MACISPDGKPTEPGTKMLRALESRLGTPEGIAKQAGLAKQKDDSYELSPRGIELPGTLSA